MGKIILVQGSGGIGTPFWVNIRNRNLIDETPCDDVFLYVYLLQTTMYFGTLHVFHIGKAIYNVLNVILGIALS